MTHTVIPTAVLLPLAIALLPPITTFNLTTDPNDLYATVCGQAACDSCTYMHLIIINVTHISMFRNYSFNFGRNVAKRGRNMERRRERNIVEPKFELKSFRPSSCVFYCRVRI